jgi:hypothetical protein
MMQINNNQSSIVTFVAGALAGLFLLSGCTMPAGAPGDDSPDARLSGPYRRVQLKASTTLDVLNLMDSARAAQTPADAVAGEDGAVQLLSQSDIAAALSGKSADGRKIWVNVVAFDEYRMTARRKYFFVSDEPKAGPADATPPAPGKLIFDAQFVIDPEVGTALYATDEAKKAAILRSLAGAFKHDVGKLAGRSGIGGTDATVATAGLMMGQVFQGISVELDQSSALARNLGNEEGIAFAHMSLGEGRVRLLVTQGIATVAVRINESMPGH